MSGHSKWSTIKRKKEKTDAQRGKIFTKIGREIAVAVRSGGADPEKNSRLKDAIAKAKSNNMPNDNILRCIKKADGDSDGANYEEIVYEGYGPRGVAVLVETMTDNKNRTAADMRHYFDKYGGSMGQSGSVSFLFQRAGVIFVEASAEEEEALMEAAIDSGADDVEFEEGACRITTDSKEFGRVCENMEEKGYKLADAEIQYLPHTTVHLDDEKDVTMMSKLLEMLEENDDVQNFWHNWDEGEQ